MSIFTDYAAYYDVLYQDKDYSGEAAFVHNLVQTHDLKVRSILDLGCGTGRHASHLAGYGYEVSGVDASSDMLKAARDRTCRLPEDIIRRLSFTQGDVRTFRLGQRFDLVMALFHVICYQTMDVDIKALLETVRSHINPGGVFLFDVWYGPTVLAEKPSVRIKRCQDDRFAITRISEGTLRSDLNQVKVEFDIFVTDKLTGSVKEFRETHNVRYFFRMEMESLLKAGGLQLFEAGEWLTKRKPAMDTFSVYCLARELGVSMSSAAVQPRIT